MHQSQHCPLCLTVCPSHEGEYFYRDRRRVYLRCHGCRLIFVPTEFHLAPAEEKAVYDLHDNRPDDPRYRTFLNRLYQPLIKRLTPAANGLDFGCGPGPALASMLQEAGFTVALYDVFYAPDQSPLTQTYDFITATEVVEHLRNPRLELQRLWRCLSEQGVLAIMTKLALEAKDFAGWHYKNDLTHVCFFSRETFEFLADCFSAQLEFVADDVVLLYKKSQCPINWQKTT